MKLLWVLVLIVGSGLSGCRGGRTAAPSPTVASERSRVLAPADRAQNTVDQLNDQQSREEQQTGAEP